MIAVLIWTAGVAGYEKKKTKKVQRGGRKEGKSVQA